MADPHSPGLSAGGSDFSDPLSPAVQAWLNDLAKAAKGMRVYAENNEMLHKYVDAAYQGLTALLERAPELNISIREDRLLYGRDDVYVNADIEEGLPFIFYRNAFRRVTLVQGMTRDELLKLIRAVVTDYKGYNAIGEDLVTTLWRYALPHLRYLTIDAISSKKGTTDPTEHEELERIQGNIEDIVAAIYKTNAPDDDIVAGVSITKEDLEALKQIRQESEEDLDLLDQATARAIANVSAVELSEVQALLGNDTRDRLTTDMLDVLVRILFKERSSRESTQTIDLLQRLFDSLVLAQDYRHAIELIDRLRAVADDTDNMQEMHIARHLLRLFAAEARVSPVLNALNDGYKTASLNEMVDFLRALGAPIAGALLRGLEIVTSPPHRRMLCELIVEFGVPSVPQLIEVASTAKWFVVRDVLALAQHFPPEKISIVIKQALAHDHPKVRAYAVGMLRGYARGLADQLIVERIQDDDMDVRMSAIRVAAARQSMPALKALQAFVTADDLQDREPRELRMALAAFAKIGGQAAVPILDGILNPGFFATLKSTEPQVAAAFALASLGAPGAESLHKGARSLNSKVRDACKRALSRDLAKGEGNDDPLTKIPAQATTNPTLPNIKLPANGDERTTLSGIPAATTEPESPLKPNANDAELSARTPSDDPLENAPPFYLYDPNAEGEVEQPTSTTDNLFRARPEMPAVMTPYPEPDQLPESPVSPPSAAGSRDILPSFPSSPAAPVNADIEDVPTLGGFDTPPPRLPPPRQPPPRDPSWIAEALESAGSADLADRSEPVTDPLGVPPLDVPDLEEPRPTTDSIPTADEVVASLFGESTPLPEGGDPLDADHVTGDIRAATDDLELDQPEAPSAETNDEPGLDAPFIPTVDSDPFATSDGQLPPPRTPTWAGSKSPPVGQPVPWVDDLVLDDEKKGD